jgi:uncharacterized membrane protein
VDKARLETFSDGVFAIAITLLVLTITQPENYDQLGRELLVRWPALAAYGVSFVVIGIMWLNHHSVFIRFRRVNRPLFYLNLALLMTVVLLPYPTGVFGEALQQREGEEQAAIFYSSVMTVNAVCWAALWLYASTGRRLLDDDFPEEERRPATIAFTVGMGLYALTIAVAFVNAIACLVVHALLALYYALDPLARHPVKGERDG